MNNTKKNPMDSTHSEWARAAVRTLLVRLMLNIARDFEAAAAERACR